MSDATLGKQFGAFTVRTIAVEATAGPDAGKSSRGERVSVGSAEGNALVLTDPHVSRYHLEVTIGPSGFALSDVGSRNGTWVGPVRLERATVPPGTVVRVGDTTLRLSEGERADVPVFGEDALAGFYGRAPATRRLMAQVHRAAQSQAAVLLEGESGTGKEVLARAIHALSARAAEPFEVVDCAALVPALVASELFGHERGAFTGADRQHTGAFERAGAGSVFLDEIGELPIGLQASLLGALERRRFRRVGGQKDIAFQARVLSATHRDLRSQVNASTFRLDLFYRLAVVTLTIPPLRERPEDIPLLVEHFLREAGHHGPRTALISDQGMAALSSQPWPGNVRELRNVIEALLAMGELPAPPPHADVDPPADPIAAVLGLTYKQARDHVLRSFESRYVPQLLARTGGNIAKAAREADMDRSHLMELMRRLGLR